MANTGNNNFRYLCRFVTKQEFDEMFEQFWNEQEREGKLEEIGYNLNKPNLSQPIDEAAYRMKIRFNVPSKAIKKFKRTKKIDFCMTADGGFSKLNLFEQFYVDAMAEIGLLTYGIMRIRDKVTGDIISAFYYVGCNKIEWNLEQLYYDKFKLDRIFVCRSSYPYVLHRDVIIAERLN